MKEGFLKYVFLVVRYLNKFKSQIYFSAIFPEKTYKRYLYIIIFLKIGNNLAQ